MAKIEKDLITSIIGKTPMFLLPASATVVDGKLACTSKELQLFSKKFKSLPTAMGTRILSAPFPKGYGVLLNGKAGLYQVHTEHDEELSAIVMGYSAYGIRTLADKYERVDVLYPRSISTGDVNAKELFESFKVYLLITYTYGLSMNKRRAKVEGINYLKTELMKQLGLLNAQYALGMLDRHDFTFKLSIIFSKYKNNSVLHNEVISFLHDRNLYDEVEPKAAFRERIIEQMTKATGKIHYFSLPRMSGKALLYKTLPTAADIDSSDLADALTLAYTNNWKLYNDT